MATFAGTVLAATGAMEVAGRIGPEIGATGAIAPAQEWSLQQTSAYGRDIHGTVQSSWAEEGFVCDKACIEGSNLRPDGMNFESKVILELKPNTDSGANAMMQARRKYMGALEQAFGKDHGWVFEERYYPAPWK